MAGWGDRQRKGRPATPPRGAVQADRDGVETATLGPPARGGIRSRPRRLVDSSINLNGGQVTTLAAYEATKRLIRCRHGPTRP